MRKVWTIIAAIGWAVAALAQTPQEIIARMEDEMARYRDLPLPAIVSIPGQEGSTGYGMNNLRHAVERAVGADILFKNNEPTQTEKEEKEGS